MPKTAPLPNWKGEDVVVLGGGSSLRGFDWDRLKDKNVIGCNHAYTLGAAIVKVVAWGDVPFWNKHKADLATYEGWVVTNFNWVPHPPPWLHAYTRQDFGLATGVELAWNTNTGCMATNLALSLGAKRVLLLGFDLGDGADKKRHWHDLTMQSATQQVYNKFHESFREINKALPHVFPGREILNVTDGRSRLTVFPTLPLKEFS